MGRFRGRRAGQQGAEYAQPPTLASGGKKKSRGRPGWKGALTMASAVVLTAGGGVMFALSGRLPEPALAWMIGGAVVALGGILLIVYYFDKWGHL